MGAEKTYHEKLKENIDTFCHLSYKVSRQFPKEEIYGITSQFRRAVISVALNYIEGYARIKGKVHRNFIEISYGSLKESVYLLDFCFKESFFTEKEYLELKSLTDEIGKMLWGMLKQMD